MYESTLTRSGLTEIQAAIYEVLLKNGPMPAGTLAKKAALKRGITYKALGELEGLGLVEKKEGAVALFAPAHPVRLKELAEEKELEAQNAQVALQSTLTSLISDFNLISGKPGVRFYEGKLGAQTVADDSLTARGEIYSYIDNEAVNRHIPDINKKYIQKRDDLKLKKKMITLDTPYMRQRILSLNPNTTEVRVIPGKYPFAAVMQIYDNKVSYITLDSEKIIGIIIDNPAIAKMHRALFEYAWSTAKPLSAE